MKALVTTGDGYFELLDVPKPSPSAGQVLVKVMASAQNPTDWKTLLLHQKEGNILGCDFAGVIESIGPNVDKSLRHVGEGVAGTVHGGVSLNGSYAEYLIADSDLLISIPDKMTFEDAAQLGVACFTSCQALYQSLQLPEPVGLGLNDVARNSNETNIRPRTVLIWGGTTATGQWAIQLAKRSGLRVITTSSRNFEYVKTLGADEVYDYADSFTPRKIYTSTGGTLKEALDCVSEGMTPNQVSMCLSKEGGTIATLLPYSSRNRGVETDFVLAYSIFGKAIQFPWPMPEKPQHRINGARYASLVTKLLNEHDFVPIPRKLYTRGLESVAEGLEYMRSGKVHGEKITYRISDTPALKSRKK